MVAAPPGARRGLRQARSPRSPGLRLVERPGLGHQQLPVLLGRGRPRLPARPRGPAGPPGRGRHLGPARHHGLAPRSRPTATGTPADAALPVTERLTDRTLVLPLFHQMSDSDQARVVEVLRTAGGDGMTRPGAARGRRSGPRDARDPAGSWLSSARSVDPRRRPGPVGLVAAGCAGASAGSRPSSGTRRPPGRRVLSGRGAVRRRASSDRLRRARRGARTASPTVVHPQRRRPAGCTVGRAASCSRVPC